MNWLEVQIETDSLNLPTEALLQLWVDTTLKDYNKETELVIRIVDVNEIATLNEKYRQKNGPTNILSFPSEIPDYVEMNLLGDLVICASILEKEAIEQNKSLNDHWAHIVIHGILHLLKFDHLIDEEAQIMEAKEIYLLSELNIKNPYLQESIA